MSDPTAEELACEILDLFVEREAGLLECLTAVVNLIVPLSIQLAAHTPGTDPVAALRSLTERVMVRVKAETGHEGARQ